MIGYVDAQVISTPLGYDIVITTDAENMDNLENLGKITCDELSSFSGGLVQGRDGVWRIHWYYGEGSIEDSLHIHMYDEAGEELDSITFER